MRHVSLNQHLRGLGLSNFNLTFKRGMVLDCLHLPVHTTFLTIQWLTGWVISNGHGSRVKTQGTKD